MPGTGVFLNSDPDTTPLALRTNVEHNHALHDSVVIFTVEMRKVPHVADSERLTVDDLGYRDDGIISVLARFGFQDELNVPQTLRLAANYGLERPIDVANAAYFLSEISIVPTKAPGMRLWRKKLFVGVSRHSADPAAYFCLPRDRTITMGSQIDL